MKRTASAIWQGELKSGSGTISTETGTLSGAPYSFATRFEGGQGTNPEELLGAAHAAWKFFKPENAFKPENTGIELHPGAVRYYKERGWM